MNKIQQTRVSKDSLLRSVILSFSTPNPYLLETPTIFHFPGGIPLSEPSGKDIYAPHLRYNALVASQGAALQGEVRPRPASWDLHPATNDQVTGLKARVSG